MPSLSFSPAALSRTIRLDAGPFTPAAVRGRSVSQARTDQLTVTGSADPGDAITLTKIGSAAWLTVPATCTHTVPFTATISASALKPGRYSETLRASHADYSNGDLAVTLLVLPVATPAPAGGNR